MASSILIALLLAIIGSSVSAAAYAQDAGMRQATSKGSLDILLEPTWNEDSQASFKVSFLNPGTDMLHEHQDYDFRILQDGNEVFSTAAQTNQPIIHNVNGMITVPYQFEQNGDYTIEVYLAGTGVGPTLIPTDESAQFNITVVPEFPVGMLGAVAALMGTAIVMSRRFEFRI